MVVPDNITIFILGRKRKVTKVGRKSMITYKGQQISLSKAIALEKQLAQKKQEQAMTPRSSTFKVISMHSAFDNNKGEAVVHIHNNDVEMKLAKTWNYDKTGKEEFPLYTLSAKNSKDNKTHTLFQGRDPAQLRAFIADPRKRKSRAFIKELFNDPEVLSSWVFTDPPTKTALLKRTVNAQLHKITSCNNNHHIRASS